ncbi:MAG: DUF447 domain-containing protein [Promethearchaeota archaeon]
MWFREHGEGSAPTVETLGFEKGCLYEVLVTTADPESGVPNTAPMGMWVLSAEGVEIRPFRDTDTFKNASAAREVAINIAGDPLLFVKTALTGWSGGEGEPELPPESYTLDEGSSVPHLRDAPLVLLAKVEHVAGESPRARLTLKVRKVLRGERIPVLPCRSNNLVLEALIHATRVKVHEGNPEKARKYHELASFYCSEALKYYPSEGVKEATARILEFCDANLHKG